jgi:hypothetical protein
MGSLNIIRIIVQIFATIIMMLAIGFIAAGILSSGWQIMVEPGVGEIHQHGLWMDYIYSNRFHMAGAPAPSVNGIAGDLFGYNSYNNYNSPLSAMESGSYTHGTGDGYYYGFNIAPGGQWIMTYKFGNAVYGDAVHRAQPFQIYALVLLALALVLTVVGMMISYCASVKLGLAIGWAVMLFFALILGAAGLIQFYVASMLPEYRFAYTDRRLQQFVGYSYWWAVVGIIGVGLSMILSIGVAVLLSLMSRRGEKAERATLVFRRKGAESPV